MEDDGLWQDRERVFYMFKLAFMQYKKVTGLELPPELLRELRVVESLKKSSNKEFQEKFLELCRKILKFHNKLLKKGLILPRMDQIFDY